MNAMVRKAPTYWVARVGVDGSAVPPANNQPYAASSFGIFAAAAKLPARSWPSSATLSVSVGQPLPPVG